MRDLSLLLNPRSVAVIGASPDPRKVRGMAVAALLGIGFRGTIYPVNPNYAEIQGFKAYPSIAEVPDEIDLAILAVAAAQLVGALRECVRNNVKTAVILAGLPAGQEGRDIQDAIAGIAQESGILVLGPNALGIWNPGANVAATFAPLVEDAESARASTPRTISIVSHSGGIGLSLYDKCFRAGMGVRYVVSTGNEADLEMVEVFDYLIEEGGTRVILAYIEGFKRPQDFAAVAAKAADRGVAIIVLKAGTSAAGERAAISHTAHLTGSNSAYDAVFERFGVQRVDDIEQMMALARILSSRRLMTGPNVLILSTGGGYGALLADACEARGIRVPDLDPQMREELAKTIPAYGTPANPVDLPGGFVLEDNGVSLSGILDDVNDSEDFHAVVLCFNLDAPNRIERMREALEPALRRLKKPALFHSPTQVAPENQRILAALGVHQYTVPECAQALASLRHLTEGWERWKRRGNAGTGIAPSYDALPAVPWTFDQTLEILSRHGIALPPQRVVHDADEAARYARHIGYPVTLKIHSAEIPHKSDIGGVVLNICGEKELRSAHAEILQNAARRAPGSMVEGVLVQKMAAKGREFAVGVVRDQDFGPLIMVSAGGVLIEVLNNTVFAPVPLSAEEPGRMIAGLKSAALLAPLRGDPPGDVAALERLLLATSNLVEAAGDAIEEIEFNPVLVHPEGKGLTVVDFLLVPGKPAPAEAEAAKGLAEARASA